MEATMSYGQSANQKKVIDALDQISEVYDSKTRNLKFNITNTYRYACSDSILEKQELYYLVRKGEYYIYSDDFEYVITSSFFIRVDNGNKQISLSEKPLLQFENIKNQGYVDQIRELLLKSSRISFDTNYQKEEYIIHLKLTNEQAQYNAIDIVYDFNYQFKLLTFFEILHSGNLFQLPNCIQISYTNQRYDKVNNQQFKLTNYLSRKGETYTPVNRYSGYKVIIQNYPYE